MQYSHLEELMINGELPSHSNVGGYPIFYITETDKVLCPYCANKTLKAKDESIVRYSVNWDGDIFCECGSQIESAY